MKRIVIILVLLTAFIFTVSCTREVIDVADDAPGKITEPGSTGGETEMPSPTEAADEEVKDEKPAQGEVPAEAEKPQEGENPQAGEKPPVNSPQESDNGQSKQEAYYTGRAVVLTYHHISLKPVSGITIKPERFEADLKMLRDEGFNVISLRQMIDAVEGLDKLPSNAVVITFDDGYESFYRYGFPLLKKYNMPASNFVITYWTENYSPSDGDLASLSPEQIREMHESGLVDIQSHSHRGHDYIIRNEEGKKGGLLAFQRYDSTTGKYESIENYKKRVLEDLKASIPIIEQYTGQKPDIFCFPFGHYNTRLVELAKEAGYRYFVTTGYGYNSEGSNKVLVKRIRSGDEELTPEKLKESIISCGSK